VSAPTVLCLTLFGAMLVVTVAAQPRRFGWVRSLKERDACAWIPIWTFFAPNPGVNDTRVLWREQLVGGEAGPWHEMAPMRRSPIRAVWNPTNRARKAVTDCAPMILQLASRDRHSLLPMLSLPYLMIVQHMAGLPGSPLGQARQFAVVNTQGEDTEDSPFQLLMISHWHRLPGVVE
jgi:hypothetical protein